MGKFVTAIRVLWIAGGFAMLLGGSRAPALRPTMLNPSVPTEAGWVSGEFKPDGVYPTTDASTRPDDLVAVGSWIDGDGWRGRSETVWLRAGLRAGVSVAGYPQHAGCSLWAEFRNAAGAITRSRCDIPDPHERWVTWNLDVPPATTELRLIAEDNAVDGGGWLAYSRPFAQPVVPWPPLVFVLAQVLSTVALALVLVFGPGLFWTSRPISAAPALAFMVGLGPAILVGIGLMVWLLGGWLSAAAIAGGSVAILWLALGGTLWRRGFSPRCSWTQGQALVVCALVSLAVASKATFSRGPEGELYRGTISRTLEVGDRSDSRISFHVVQVVAHHLAPASPEAERYFAPYTFFSRGPLAGLAAAPVVLAVGGRPPQEMPDGAWAPFDRTGFAAYRITMIVLGSMVVFALFAVLAVCAGEAWALIGAGLLALSPFGVHEVMFTWPKWEATTWLLVSFLFCHERRPWLGGCALGIGFLFHPLAGLWLPWLALWAAGRSAGGGAAWMSAGVRFGIGASALILPWLALGALTPHLPTSVHAGQSDFMRYWTLTDYQPATWTGWLIHRWTDFANTFFPFWLWFRNAGHFALNSVYAPSGGLVKFSFLWWNTLPLGLGLGVWAISAGVMVRNLRVRPAAAWLLVIGPALALIAYWGAFSTGLMRECGHPLFVAIIGVTCVGAAESEGWLQRVLRHPATPWWQLPETLLMLWLTTLANPAPFPSDLRQFDPLYFSITVLALGLTAWLLSSARRRRREGSDGERRLNSR